MERCSERLNEKAGDGHGGSNKSDNQGTLRGAYLSPAPVSRYLSSRRRAVPALFPPAAASVRACARRAVIPREHRDVRLRSVRRRRWRRQRLLHGWAAREGESARRCVPHCFPLQHTPAMDGRHYGRSSDVPPSRLWPTPSPRAAGSRTCGVPIRLYL